MESKQRISPHANENIVILLWAKYFPYWPIFLLLIVLSTIGAWFYLQFTLPVYSSSATILIKDEKKGIDDSKMLGSLNLLASKKIVENETEVIKSRRLMKEVILDLRLYSQIFEKGRWRDLPVYNTSPLKIEVYDPELLIEVKKVEFTYNPVKKVVQLDRKNYLLDQWVQTRWGNFRFSATNVAYNGKASYYFTLVHPKRAIEGLLKSLDVSASNKLSSVINLTLKDEVPKRSEDILNALITAYNKASITEKNVLADSTLSFLDGRLRYVTNDLNAIERQLQQYKTEKGAIDLSSQGKLFLENVSGIDQKLSDVKIKLAMLKQVEQYVFLNSNRGGLAPSTLGIDDPILAGLLQRLYDAEVKYEKLKRTTGENNPGLISLADEIKKIKPSILENIHSQQLSLEANKQNLYSTNNSYSSLLQGLPKQERDLLGISREQNIKSSIYTFLLQKREETALSLSSNISDTRVIDNAESTLDPVGLPGKFIYIIAMLLALGFGIAVITLRDMFNSKILFRKEIEAITSFPVIGEIALEKFNSPLVIKEGASGLIAEEFRMLRTSLYYFGKELGGKSVLITSTIAGEGKSFVAINLAMSLALTGKKVIVVEFDLNNPTLANIIGLDKTSGVSDYLRGNAKMDDVTRKIYDNDNLFIMTAGNLPNNSSDLILSDRTPQLLNYLKSKFDYLIIDSGPIGLLSDGYVLSRHCDTTLFVVRHNYTPKKMLEQLEKNNRLNELKNIALVFNGVGSRGFSKSYFGYGDNFLIK